jgi:prolyl oligopeptidase
LALILTSIAGGCDATTPPTAPSKTTTPTNTLPATPHAKMPYPDTPRGDQVDTYHGHEVADPYRWLEDSESQATRRWVEAQNDVARAYLDAVPYRDWIARRLTELNDYPRQGIPSVKGVRYFFSKNSGLQNQSVLYTAESLDDEPRVLLDPNAFSDDGTVALSGIKASDDGRLLAYGVSEAGSDWQTWRFRDVESGDDLDDALRWVKFSDVAWLPNASGFYYSRYDKPTGESELQAANYFQKLYLHRIGTPQSDDLLVFKNPDEKEWGFSPKVSDDGRFLVINVWRGSDRKNAILYQRLDVSGADAAGAEVPNAEVLTLTDTFDAEYAFVGNDGDTFWLRTDWQADNGQLIAVDLAHTEPENRRTVIAESSDAVEGIELVGGRFFTHYLHDAHSAVRMFDTSGGSLGEVELPGMGTASGFGGRSDDSETFYAFESFTTPPVILRYDVAAEVSSVIYRADVTFDSDVYETSQVKVKSADGTEVPVFVTMRKGTEPDGQQPTLLYGYGGFNVALTPTFSSRNALWLEMGGVYAMANLRGGGEYGRQWHEAGKLLNKQRVFNDFIATAEWLTDSYSSPARLAINGGSNGGLLVGTCLTQRPELFGAAVPVVGVMDMLRFHRFTIGWAWVPEYGSSDDAEQFEVLYRYSPLHNIADNVLYPPTMVLTGDHDDRVVPGHSLKFAAEMQAAQAKYLESHEVSEDNVPPILLRVDIRAGHGAGKPTSKRIDEAADVLAFLALELDMPMPPAESSPRANVTAKTTE